MACGRYSHNRRSGLSKTQPTHDTEVASYICVGKDEGIKGEAEKGMEACGNTFWGSTGVPAGAKVRVVGIGACSVAMGTTKETM